MKFTLDVKWKIGEQLEFSTGLVTVIGYDFIQDRGLRYTTMRTSNGEVKWDYLHEFEISTLLVKNQ